MDKAAYLVILALAIWQTVEVIHHSELFAKIREISEKDAKSEPTGPNDLRPFIGKIMICPFCLAHWVAFAYAGLLCTPLVGVVSWWTWTLAAVRLANIGNDLVGGLSNVLSYHGTGDSEEEEDDGNNRSA